MVSKTNIEMAREAGFAFEEQDNLFVVDPNGVCKFAELIRADEREACAKVCEEVGVWPSLGPRHCAEAIRARGNT